jgi:formyl-CoA transferase
MRPSSDLMAGRTREHFYREAREDLAGPLHGTRVLDVTTAWAGPMAACLLADFGADVIRVEMPDNRDGEVPPEIPGTGLSWFRQTVNRNKRSVALDLRQEDARHSFDRLVATADIIIENFRPGTLDEWGVGYDHCREVKPDVVFVSVSGWGQYGPRSVQAGYDPTIQAASGWLSLNGAPDGECVRAPTFLADDLAGTHAALGALAALQHRDRTGEGQHVDVALLDVLLFQSTGLLTLAAAGAPLQRWGNQVEAVAPSNVFVCSDGSLYLTVALDRHWRGLVEVAGRPELARAPGFATNRERCANRTAVDAVVAGWCRTLTVDAVVSLLEERGICVSRVRTYHEAASDLHVLERGLLQTTTLCNGTTAPLVGPAVKFSRTPTRVRRGAPRPGADNEEVLATIDVDQRRNGKGRPRD